MPRKIYIGNGRISKEAARLQAQSSAIPGKRHRLQANESPSGMQVRGVLIRRRMGCTA